MGSPINKLTFTTCQVATAARELSDESLARFTNDINKRIAELTHGSDNNEKLGAIAAIGNYPKRFRDNVSYVVLG